MRIFIMSVIAFILATLLGMHIAMAQAVNAAVVRISPTSSLPSTCNTGDIRIGPSPTYYIMVCRANTWYNAVDSATFTNPMTTNGDMIYQAAGSPARLAIGTANYVMRSTGTAPAWGLLVDANIDSAAAITRSKTASGTAYRILANSAAGVMSENAALTASRVITSDTNGQLASSSITTTTLAFLDATSSIQTQLDAHTTSISGLVSDTAYAGSWNGVTTVAPSKNAVYDEVELRAPKASPTFSGTITTPLTASRVLTTGASSELAASSVTTTTLGYLDATSSIQTQLDAKVAKSSFAAKGDFLIGTGAGTLAAVGSGATNGQVLVADSGQASGWRLGSAGGGGGSLTWVEGADGMTPLPFEENEIKTYLYPAGVLAYIYTAVPVPQSYNAGNEITLRLKFYSPDSSNTVGWTCVATLIRAGTDAITSTTNQRTSTQADITLASANRLETSVCDLTASGQINSTAVAGGDLIKVRVNRKTSDTASSDARLVPHAAEVTFNFIWIFVLIVPPALRRRAA